MADVEEIRKKFPGSLSGVTIGDAIGASWEGYRMATEHEIKLITSISHTLRYTDNTHMTIGVAESLVEYHHRIQPPR